MSSSLHPSSRSFLRRQSKHPTPCIEPLETRRLLASIVVNSAGDGVAVDGLVTLREAIIAANTDTTTDIGATGNGNDTITFDADVFATPQTVQLASALPALASDMTIAGPGADLLTVRGTGFSGFPLAVSGPPVFHVASGVVNLSGLTITNGRRGVLNNATLTLSDSAVKNNAVPHQSLPPGGPILSGGGINNTGTLTVQNSTFYGNFAARGGGISNSGTLTVQNTTLDRNLQLFEGGGIYNSGSLTVQNSALIANGVDSFNSSSSRGGAIFNAAGTATLQNSTISGNRAAVSGGGIYNTAALTVQNSTIVGNSADGAGNFGGIFNGAGAVLTAHNSIIASNSLVDLQNSGTAVLQAVFMNGDPMLGPLQDNGGPTLTHAPLSGSPVINAGSNGLIPAGMTTDQRGAGFPRVFGQTVDIGALELNNTHPTTTAIPAVNTTEDAADIVIDLKNYFDDVEDGSAGLFYNFADISNPELFESGSIDGDGLLTLNLAPDASGTTEVRIRATDSGGLFVEQTLLVTVVSAADQLLLLQEQVAALPELNQAIVKSLLAKLNLDGNSSGDSGKVTGFIQQVEVMISTGKISEADGLPLLNAAEDLLVSVA